ncbi:uncharacterized protein B0J16DRAFT_351190 [Fusarium flagelliforme]|uniref:uncharacterized protein n=1 Tax=Fusarium flagelliforme TaxID=2675880 RepID=UPI001E8E9350|nr:uncharacterized protein B0J16DRAFT_351190 [Fusarium flagelliforme]KAH7173988.1 hypothetical protein B0J16DRAFT_351190 [Fusarium flagelliforme]
MALCVGTPAVTSYVFHFFSSALFTFAQSSTNYLRTDPYVDQHRNISTCTGQLVVICQTTNDIIRVQPNFAHSYSIINRLRTIKSYRYCQLVKSPCLYPF